MKRAPIAAVLAVVLLVVSTGPALGVLTWRCNPGRADVNEGRSYGVKQTVTSENPFESIRANFDNSDIPYNEGSIVTAVLVLADTNPAKQGALGQPHIKVTMQWSASQGHLTSTTFFVSITDEYGNVWLRNNHRVRNVGEISGSDTNLVVELQAHGTGTQGPIGAIENYELFINGNPVWEFQATPPFAHGAEDFEVWKAYVYKDNNGSQVPGRAGDTMFIDNVMYSRHNNPSQLIFANNPGTFHTDADGAVVVVNGNDVRFRDTNCA